MGAKVKIIKNETGEARFYQDDYFDGGGVYQWVDGNYSCDCNRAILFGQAHGCVEDHECGDGAYSVPYAELPDGTIIKLDDAD